MTIRKTSSSKAMLAVATDASSSTASSSAPASSSSSSAAPAAAGLRVHRPHHHYAPHTVVIVASPSRRASLLQRQVARALDAIDMDNVVTSLEHGDAIVGAVSDLYASPPTTSLLKSPPPPPASAPPASTSISTAVSPSSGLQISPNAVKRKRSHSTASTVSSISTSPSTSLSLLNDVGSDSMIPVGSPPVAYGDLRVDMDAVDKPPLNRVVVAKRVIKGGVTPSKRCKDKKKKLKVDVIERALKRFRTELRTHHSCGDSSASDGVGGGSESCFEFTSVCHRDERDGDAGITTPRHPTAPSTSNVPTEWLTTSMSSNRPIERGNSRRSEGVAQHMRVQVGVAAAQGARAYMEDRFAVTARLFEHHAQRDDVQSPASLLALYDGHNGPLAAEYGARRFRELLSENEYLLDLCKRPNYVALSDDDIERVEDVLKDVFETVDDEIVELTISEGKRDGSTVLLGLLLGGKMFVANLGDTRGVLGTTGNGSDNDGSNDDVVRVSVDHKPDLHAETARIEEAGGKVIFSGCWRVAHDEVPLRLAVSRSLGDHPLKANLPLSCSAPLVSVVPDIQVLDVSGASDDVLVFATDGLWDRLSDDDAIRIARTKISEFKNSNPTTSASLLPVRNAMQSAAIALVETALVKRSMDNITAMVIGFSSDTSERLDDVEVGDDPFDVETMDDL